MNTYQTTDEKYLHAVDKISYGRTRKALQLLNEIISNDPSHARAHYQLGKLYYYELDDYQSAGYHFRLCFEAEPSFPDNYFNYLQLAVFLNMGKLVNTISAKALTTAGVHQASVYEQLGLFNEHNMNWVNAIDAYHNALLAVTGKKQQEDIENSIDRVKLKMQIKKAYRYQLTE